MNNGYTATNAAGPNSGQQQQTDLSNLNSTYGAQSDLAKMLLAQAQGQGPNIANLQLQQATNQNNQQAAGAIASQKGMNPALAQRIISQQQALNNQNAAGQSGVLRAQQQLAAQQGLGNVYAQQAGEANSNFGTITNAQQAANSANAQIAQNNANQNAGIAGGIIGGGSQILSSILAKGGTVGDPKHMEILTIPTGSKVHPMYFDDGGTVEQIHLEDPSAEVVNEANAKEDANPTMPEDSGGAPSTANAGGGYKTNAINSSLSQGQDVMGAISSAAGSGGGKSGGGGAGLLALLYNGGKVPAMVSPGERYIPPHMVEAVTKGHKKASDVAPKIPGKAKVKGDSEKNDTVPANLETGGVVIPRTKADNDRDAQEFMMALKKEKAKKEGPQGFSRVLAAKRKNG